MSRLLSCAFACIAFGLGVSAAAEEARPVPDLPAALQPLNDEALGDRRGGFLAGLVGIFPALAGSLPPNNTVSVQIGDNPPQTASGPGPQSIDLGNFFGSAQSGPGSTVPLSFSSTTNTTTTRTFTRTFSFP